MVSGNDSGATLGGWADEDFKTTVSQFGGIGAHADVPDEARFVASVARLLRRRTAAPEPDGESDSDPIAIFILKPNPPNSVLSPGWEPMLDEGLIRVGGRLWFTAAPVVSAHYVDLPQYTNNTELFSYVTDELKVGELPTIVFSLRTATSQFRWYPDGLSFPDNVDIKPLAGDVSPDEVFEAIARLHSDFFITPGSMPQGGRLWRNASEYRVKRDAEALVQSHLKAGLVMRFPYCTIRHEQPQQAGRTDIEIEQRNPHDGAAFTLHAIIELKVLRSFGSTGSKVTQAATERQIREGVRQAAAYRKYKSAEWSALCCFDMRRIDVGCDSCFASVRDWAKDLEVLLRRWFLYASTEAHRQAMFPCN